MNSITRIISRMLAVSLLVFAAACSDRESVLYADDLPSATTDTPAADEAEEPGNIVDVASEAGAFTTLLEAAQKAGLVEALSDESASLTVFAPSDDAFAALGVSVDDLSAEALAGILTYHVLDSAVSVSEAGALAPGAATTLNGADVALTTPGDGNLYVNFSKVVSYDIEASNGVIHVIDKVLLPPDMTSAASSITDIVVASDDFTTLEAAVTKAGLGATLADAEAAFTVFAPTDAAFEALGVSVDDVSEEALANILLYHVVAGAEINSVDAILATGGTSAEVTMANGETVTVSVSEMGLKVNDANVIAYDIVAANGIIHVIDAVLEPAAAERVSIEILDAGIVSEPFFLNAFDSAIGYGGCAEDPASCPSIGWDVAFDSDRGNVLEVTHSADSVHAGLILEIASTDLSAYADGGLISFDIKVVTGNTNGIDAKIDCGFPCTSGDRALNLSQSGQWETVTWNVAELVASSDPANNPNALDLTKINTGLVLIPAYADSANVVYRLDNVRWYIPPTPVAEQPVLDAGVAAEPFFLNAFDSAIGYGGCAEDPASCPSIGWDVAFDSDRGNVLEVTHSADSVHAGLILEIASTDLSAYADGGLISFDIKVVTGNTNGIDAKVDCGFPCTSGDRALNLSQSGQWETVTWNVAELVASSDPANNPNALDLTKINTGLVVIPAYADSANVVYRLDNVRWYIPPTPVAEQPVLDAGVAAEPFFLNAFDSAISYGGCAEDPVSCPSIGWDVAFDSDRGSVLEVTHSADSVHAGLILEIASTDLSAYADGGLISFDIKVVTGNTNGIDAKIDCGFPCTSGDRALNLSQPALAAARASLRMSAATASSSSARATASAIGPASAAAACL
jgi:uncharacterized surface protein with fasciclin (FAS1) repeats